MTKVAIDRELLERLAAECEAETEWNCANVPAGTKAATTRAIAMKDTAESIRAILAAPRQPEEDAASILLPALRQYMHNDGSGLLAGYEYERTQQIVAELREEISDLHTTMMAAAVEIQEHWPAHCDEEGYGPANLMNRLERGIAAQYGYTAQTVVQIEAERDTLRQQLAERDATIARLEAGIPRIQEQSHQMRQQRDRLAGLLSRARGCIDAMGWDELETDIDAILAQSAPAEGEVGELVEVLRDVAWCIDSGPSCQIGVVERCKCAMCVTGRIRAALAKWEGKK